jgi:hypothetical protein
VPAWCSGDFSADGVVDGADFNLWNSNKFLSSLRPASGGTVPEPQSIAAFLVLAAMLRRRRK